MDKFSLKWNDFPTNVVQSFQQLRHEEDFSDVTLVGDDFKPISAHKVVLSSCSEYFKNVLQNSQKHSHPVLCLQGLRKADLRNILDYIYNGELNIYQEDLEGFMLIAQRLKLEGLNGKDEDEDDVDFQEQSAMNDSTATGDEKIQNEQFYVANNRIHLGDLKGAAPLIGTSFSTSLTSIDTGPLVREAPVVGIAVDEKRHVAKGHQDKKIVIPSGFADIASLDEKLVEMFSRDQSGMYSCHNCPKIFKKRAHMLEHVETHVEGLQFACNFCSKSLRSRNTLKNHILHYHTA